MITFVKNGTIKVPKMKDGTRVEIKVIRNTRTNQQNKALYLYFRLLAEHLNNLGYNVQKTVKIPIDWTPETIKLILWATTQKFAVGTESTKDLKKQGDIEIVHDTITRLLARDGIPNIPFPDINNQNFDEITITNDIELP